MATEKRLIDGNKAQAVLTNIAEHLLEAGNPEMAGAVGYAAEVIGNQKEVDAVVVVHGQWNAEKDEYEICATDFTCSNCKETFCSGEIDDEDFILLMKYCPNCGAKMDRERSATE